MMGVLAAVTIQGVEHLNSYPETLFARAEMLVYVILWTCSLYHIEYLVLKLLHQSLVHVLIAELQLVHFELHCDHQATWLLTQLSSLQPSCYCCQWNLKFLDLCLILCRWISTWCDIPRSGRALLSHSLGRKTLHTQNSIQINSHLQQ